MAAVAACVAVIAGCSATMPSETAANTAAARKPAAKYEKLITSLEPFFRPMQPPGKDDWLSYFKENGQTFAEYLDDDPTLPTKERRKIYIRPLGKFSAMQKRIINDAAEYLEVFYALPVEVLSVQKLPARIPKGDFRAIEYNRTRQIRTGYIMDTILRPKLPKDAAALIAFTDEDLYPNNSMSFVFGQASLDERVGVWSLHRLDDNANDRTFLMRTLKIAAHETGHMFGMRHCTKYECLMSGTNNLAETDSRPIDACPECTAKVIFLSKTDARERYLSLAKFAGKKRLSAEQRSFRDKAAAVPE